MRNPPRALLTLVFPPAPSASPSPPPWPAPPLPLPLRPPGGPPQRRADEGPVERVRPRRPGAVLRVKLCPHKPGVVRQFDDLRQLLLRVDPGDAHPVRFQDGSGSGGQLVAVAGALLHLVQA